MNWIKELKDLYRWKVYSQSHEEAFIAKILWNIAPETKFLVDLGAWDGFHLSNTRLLIESGYKSLLVDGDNRGNNEVLQKFITRENIVEIFKENNVPENFALLCIDLDGNDLHILEKVLEKYKPKLIVAEFNPIFNEHESKTIAYNPNHRWNEDDYYGFSFAAGKKLAEKFGYTVIFQNDNLNMYFVENKSLLASLAQNDDKEIPPVSYSITNYHPKAPAESTNWINY